MPGRGRLLNIYEYIFRYAKRIWNGNTGKMPQDGEGKEERMQEGLEGT